MSPPETGIEPVVRVQCTSVANPPSRAFFYAIRTRPLSDIVLAH